MCYGRISVTGCQICIVLSVYSMFIAHMGLPCLD
uniref:Uncharacterized protein n=1 Tax=Anguilla anguilla TaxID=7936 RepID=A0A0E9P7S3_ANGAN